jgi:putative transposase
MRYPGGGGRRRAGGTGLQGAGGAKCKLSPAQLAELHAVLDAGPAACGYEDQCWTLARIAEVVWQRFGAEYRLAGMDLLLHRIGCSVQVPARRSAERDEEVSWRRNGRSALSRGHPGKILWPAA